MDLSIVIPTHNERENVSLLIYLIDKLLANESCEVLVVDDGSTDGTANACKKLAGIVKCKLRIFVRDRKLGLGNAYKRGVAHATGKFVILMDADLSHDPRDIPRLLAKIRESRAGIVIGSRYMNGGGMSNWPFPRKVVSKGANLLARIFTGRAQSDMTNSYRIYRRDVLRAGIQNVRASGFAYQMDILFRCNTQIDELPVCFYERACGCSKLCVKEYFEFLAWGSLMLIERAGSFMQERLYISVA